MKRILFISPQPFFQWRGSPIRVGFNVRALAESGFKVDLLTLPVGEEKKIPGVNVIRVPNIFGVDNVAIGPSAIKAAFDVLLLIKGLALMLKNKYAVVHGVEEAGAVALMLGRSLGAGVIFEKHSDPFSYKKGFFKNLILSLYEKVEKATARNAQAVICTGPGLVRQVLDAGASCPVHHIFDIPSSLSESTPDKAAKCAVKLKAHKDEVLITYVGSFAVYQGVDLMFEAIPGVVKQNTRARFVIIGGNAREIEARKQWVRSRGCEASVSFLGKVPPEVLPDYLAASDILLAPRLSGVNTPLKLLDYMKAGQAIVATDVEANRLILDPTNAVLVAPEPPGLARGILDLLENEALRGKLGRQGHRLYLEKYNYKEFKRRLAHCYRGVFNREASF